MKKTTRFLTAAVLFAAPAVLAFASNATATPAPSLVRFHLALSKSEPAKSDTVATAKAIKLWFTESVQLAATGIMVMDAAHKNVALKPITIAAEAKSPAVAEFTEALKPGTYMVDWKTMSADGHPVKGSFSFTVGKKHAH